MRKNAKYISLIHKNSIDFHFILRHKHLKCLGDDLTFDKLILINYAITLDVNIYISCA